MSVPARLAVDDGLCASTGVCESVAPDLFEIGDDGGLVLLEPAVPAGRLAAAQLAVRSCPTGALRLVEGAGPPA